MCNGASFIGILASLYDLCHIQCMEMQHLTDPTDTALAWKVSVWAEMCRQGVGGGAGMEGKLENITAWYFEFNKSYPITYINFCIILLAAPKHITRAPKLRVQPR